MHRKMRALGGVLAITGVVLATNPQTASGSVIDLLGEQDFADGQTPILTSAINNAGVGEPFPFDGTLFGSDIIDDSLGSFSYTHTFNLGGDSATAAELTIGLIDHDSFSANFPVNTIDVFFDGVQQPDAQFVGISMRPSSASVITMPVPLGLIADGELLVQFVATNPGISFDGNSLGADFSKLEVFAIPEPSSLILFALGGMLLSRKMWVRG